MTSDDPVYSSVDPEQLKALGVDPEPYLKSGSNPDGGWSAYLLNRTRDARLIERVRSIREPHKTAQ